MSVENKSEFEKRTGRVHLITGPMFSGKTDELVRRLRKAKIASKNIVAFSPAIDDRYGDGYNSHAGARWEDTISVDQNNPKEMLSFVKASTDIVAIDEAQFFNEDIVEVVNTFVHQGKTVLIASLRADSRDEPFGFILPLMFMAEEIKLLTAICVVCGEEAHHTQRLIPGGEKIKVGGKGVYEARCRKHHVVPGKPETGFK
jgi:thymidine kinase